jgi:hypothetical protein
MAGEIRVRRHPFLEALDCGIQRRLTVERIIDIAHFASPEQATRDRGAKRLIASVNL